MNVEALCLRLKEEVARAHKEGKVQLKPWGKTLVDGDGPLHPETLYAFAEKLTYVARRIERTTNAYQGAKSAGEIIPTD